MATSAPAAPTDDKSRIGKVGLVVIGLITAVCAGGWAFVMANVGQRPGIEQQTIAYTVLSDASVKVTYSVAKDKKDEVRCVVDAFDKDFAIVAHKEITVPRGTKGDTWTETLPTSRRATGARVQGCHTV
ncbi:DUF4307 domain-containing protein [Actinomadura barringtoniae]|uniref:DUF4307 domain-containing protein n=1 Tax=Actinomadura barringtoniae TaxID=1427535 RepID=A0A939P748_9ACTN|nr:DUF4307 domain-containing protein [Actinomadura barringtoniae]MBO2446922.1 DUF4307 domain-containing protein [Actinomadura barringtoniae]